MRIFISTGEVSGDLQGAMLVTALHRQAERLGIPLEIVALGGDRMAAAGATLLGNTTAIGSIGLVEALPYIIPTLQLRQRAKQYLSQHPPDLVVMIDYVGPNIGIGKYLRRHLPQVPLVYYIAPQEWVWSINANTTQAILEITDRLLAIFPAEAAYYEKRGVNVTYVGHPLIDRFPVPPDREAARQQLGISEDQVAIALLPASRQQELKYLLPILLETAQRLQEQLPQVQFWVPLSRPEFQPILEQAFHQAKVRATVLVDPNQTVLAAADLAIAKSGTVNLELALMGVPQVVFYRVNRLTAWIAEHILKFSVPFMSPPNLVMMKSIVPEFMQQFATPEALTTAALGLLTSPARRQRMQEDYQQMRQAMGEPGVCDRAALEILKMVNVES